MRFKVRLERILSFGLLLMAVTANSACVRRCPDGTAPPCGPGVVRVAVLSFIVLGDTADSSASLSFSRQVAASLEHTPWMEVTPWEVARAAQHSGVRDWWRQTSKPLGVRYLVSVGTSARFTSSMAVSLELTDARNGQRLLSDWRYFERDSLAAATDWVVRNASSALGLLREAPRAPWKPTRLAWVFLTLLAVTTAFAFRRRTRKPVEKDVAAKVDALIFAFKDPDRTQHEASVRKMIALGIPAVESLIRYMSHDDEWARLMATAALGKMKDPRALEPLRKALLDPDQGVRHMATLALRELSAECETPRLIEQLRSLRARIHEVSATPSDGVLTVGSGVGQAHDNIEIICRNLDDAVACLETGRDPAGRPITHAEIAAGLRRLATAARQPASMALLTMVLGDGAARTLERRLGELEETANVINGR